MVDHIHSLGPDQKFDADEIASRVTIDSINFAMLGKDLGATKGAGKGPVPYLEALDHCKSLFPTSHVLRSAHHTRTGHVLDEMTTANLAVSFSSAAANSDTPLALLLYEAGSSCDICSSLTG